MFAVEQTKVYKDLKGGAIGENLIPNTEHSKKLWSEIWSIEKEHNKEAKWLHDLKREQNNVHMGEWISH